MTMMPTFECYMENSNGNYGLNSLRFFDAEGNVFYFSYKTLVAFKRIDGPLVCRQNEWGPTTGKHLNYICPDKANRVDAATFERFYAEYFPNA